MQLLFQILFHQCTPLHMIARLASGGYENTVEFIVGREADINIHDNKEVSIWDYTMEGGSCWFDQSAEKIAMLILLLWKAVDK